ATLPSGPRSVSRFPHLFKLEFVAQGIHTGPESGVLESHELAVARQPLHWRVFEHRLVAINIVEHPGFEHEEGAIDPPLGCLWLLLEPCDPLAIENHMPVASRRPNGGHRRQLSMVSMEGE